MKSMKILGVLAAASLLFSVSGFAQENANRDANGNVVRGPYETNAFWDNWFAGAGLGFNSTWNWANRGSIWYVTAPGLALDLTVGKWFTPEWGARLRYTGLSSDAGFSLKPFQWGIFDISTVIIGRNPDIRMAPR